MEGSVEPMPGIAEGCLSPPGIGFFAVNGAATEELENLSLGVLEDEAGGLSPCPAPN